MKHVGAGPYSLLWVTYAAVDIWQGTKQFWLSLGAMKCTKETTGKMNSLCILKTHTEYTDYDGTEWLIAWFWDIDILLRWYMQNKINTFVFTGRSNIGNHFGTWHKLLEACLTYNLEDKVDFKERGNDTIIRSHKERTSPKRGSWMTHLILVKG